MDPDNAGGCRPACLPFELMGLKALVNWQQWPEVSTLLSVDGEDRAQAAVAKGSVAGLDPLADLAVDDCLLQRSLFSAVHGFDALDLQNRPGGCLAFELLIGGQVVAGGVVIPHHHAGNGMTQKNLGRRSGAAQALEDRRHKRLT